MSEAQFRRMRAKCNGQDFTKESWEADLVGIWYGAWKAADFNSLSSKHNDPKLLLELSKINRRDNLKWPVTSGMLKTVWKFWDIRPKLDWVFTQFDGKIHVAQLSNSIPSGDARFDHLGQVYKSCRIVNKRSFSLSLLPDCFRLLASAGQANCHEVHGTRKLIELLCECKDETEVLNRWARMTLAERVDALGPKSWESICEAYLILEEQYLRWD